MPLAWTGPLVPPPGLTGRLRRVVTWLVLVAGLYLPAPLVAWFQNVAGLLG